MRHPGFCRCAWCACGDACSLGDALRVVACTDRRRYPARRARAIAIDLRVRGVDVALWRCTQCRWWHLSPAPLPMPVVAALARAARGLGIVQPV